jgi:hypothetical protein
MAFLLAQSQDNIGRASHERDRKPVRDLVKLIFVADPFLR